MGMFVLPKTLLLILFWGLEHSGASSTVHMCVCVCVFLSFACVVIRSFMQANLYSKNQTEGLELSGKALCLSISKILR